MSEDMTNERTEGERLEDKLVTDDSRRKEAADRITGTTQLLNRESGSEYLAESTQRIAAKPDADKARSQSAFIFRLGEEWLALPTRVILEVAEFHSLHRIPRRLGGALLGLVCVRGELLVCGSVGTILGLGESGRSLKGGRLLVVGYQGAKLAFPVDEIHGIWRYNAEDVLEGPATLTNGNSPYTTGLLPWKDKTAGCLDDELLFYTMNKSFA
jgi:chemotaxis-related protein WspD